MPDRGTHSIGEVIALLTDEFPDLTVSKIRFLEGQELIAPRRSPAGYRLFSDDDVRRVRYILREQRDHFLPLKVIKSKLTAWERGEEPLAEPQSGPPPESYFNSTSITLTADELSQGSGLNLRQLDELVAQGVIEPTKLPDRTTAFREQDLILARAAHRLLANGLESRHLRTLRLSVDREIDLFSQLVAPLLRHRNPDNRRKAAEILADCGQAASEFQAELVRSRLHRLLDGP